MSRGFFNTLKDNSKEAAYRVAGTQVIKATKNGLLQAMRRKGITNKHVDTVSNLLDTELGTAGLSTVVGLILTHLPRFKDDTLAQGIAKEFSVGGLAAAGNIIVNKAITDFLPTLKALPLIKDIPLLTSQKIRVDTQSTSAPVYEELEEEPVYHHTKLSRFTLDDFDNS